MSFEIKASTYEKKGRSLEKERPLAAMGRSNTRYSSVEPFFSGTKNIAMNATT